ncbi:hypothetical protein HAX54_012878 [Datura stramonium]|uniref:F-box domain-containing protein n=1 Tax=Datura stramonium TaxID=4076 RepID=A0ABS8RZQ6_DATST|nr:hypothetical protein [Datura stramonium]
MILFLLDFLNHVDFFFSFQNASLRRKWYGAYSLRQIKIRCGYQVNVASKVVDLLEPENSNSNSNGECQRTRRRINNCLLMLPEDCAVKILAFTTPLDVCRFTLVSKSVQSAAESDSVWANFLPSDYQSIISASLTPVPDFLSKKDLFVYLCRNPLLIDGGRKVKENEIGNVILFP